MTRRQLIQYLTYSAGGMGAFWLGASNSWAAQFLRERITEVARIPETPLKRPDLSTWTEKGLYATWIGHATVLMRVDGLWIITDPAMGDRVGLDLRFGTFGPKRFIEPALTVQDLPSIDLLLLSHAHMDHMDLPTLRGLKGSPVCVTARYTSDIIKDTLSGPIHELGWNESRTFDLPKGSVTIQGLEVRHWGARWGRDQYRGYNAYSIKRNGYNILFGGDTAYTEVFRSYKTQAPFHLACMPIGAYEPWIRMHCNPEQAVQMANDVGAEFIMPIHHQTYRLSREPMHEPQERFIKALGASSDRAALQAVGETFRIS